MGYKVGKMSKCKIHDGMPDVCMVTKNECYMCILNKWPPKSRKQIRQYKKAVSIMLALSSPLTVITSPAIVEKVGLDNLKLIEKIIKGSIVSHKPPLTFQQRLTDYLEVKDD